jgi:hypothetical protein
LVAIARPTVGAWPRVIGAIAIVVVLVAGLALLAWRSRGAPRPARSPSLLGAMAAGVVLLAIGGFFLQRTYVDDRFVDSVGMPDVYAQLRDVSDARIAIVGFNAQYQLYGNDLSNHVQYVAHRSGDRHSTPIRDCREWRRALNEGRYDYVVVTTGGYPFPVRQPAPEAEWTAGPDATLVIERVAVERPPREAKVWLFELHGKLDPDACPKERTG